TGVEPVNVILRTSLLSVKIGPIFEPSPITHCTTSVGKPASCASSTKRIIVNGVSSAGLTINVQPAASAGPALRVIIAAGKFHGVIAATKPTPSRVTIKRLFVVAAGIVRP